MSRGVNKVILVGNVGQAPETRTFASGGCVTNISVATSESWLDKQTGNREERTEWHRVVLKDRGNYKMGQYAAQSLRKGSKVYIEGSLRTRKWQDGHGNDRYTTEIIASEFQALDPKEQAQQPQQGAQFQQRPMSHVEQSNQHHQAPNAYQSARDGLNPDLPY